MGEDVRVVFKPGVTAEDAERVQTDLSRTLAHRSALVPPSIHLVVELSEGDAAQAVEAVRAALGDGDDAVVAAVDRCPCPAVEGQGQPQGASLVYKMQRRCAGAREPVPAAGCATEYHVPDLTEGYTCVPVVFDAWGLSSSRLPIRQLHGRFSHSGENLNASDGIVQWDPGGDVEITPSKRTIPLEIGRVYSDQPVFREDAELSLGLIRPHIDPTGSFFHVSTTPESPEVSPVTLKGVAKVCQDQPFDRTYEVVVDIPRR